MSVLQIEANIYQQDGTSYQVKLHTVPRIGELISLFSSLEQAAGKPSKMHYEVVQVVHEVHDVSEKYPQSKDGAHFVTIHVKPSQSNLLK